jgi:hypothetical protein
MVRSAARKVMWVGRATVFMVGLAVILALVFGVATAALGAPMSTFKLGQINTSNAISTLVGAVTGSNLKIENTSTGANATALELKVDEGNAPLAVNSTAGKATNLDADKLDGLDSTDFAATAYKRTVVVSPVGTAAQNGTALKNALAGITNASATNPYLLKIEPGVYDLGSSDTPLTMKEWVDVEGSGEGVTTLTATGSATDHATGTVVGAGDSELRFLTAKNTGGATYAVAIYYGGAGGFVGETNISFRMTHVTANASGGAGPEFGSNFGVFSSQEGGNVFMTIRDSRMGASSAAMEANGVGFTRVIMTEVDGVVTGTNVACYGVYDENLSNPGGLTSCNPSAP